ncbi:MAG: DNA-binding NarL/FixJ family response regulator [Colwellia sp.]|jgi:DNA-binding NarL/FixJ family response regulator
MKSSKNIYIISRLIGEKMSEMNALLNSLGFNVQVIPANAEKIAQMKTGVVILDCLSLYTDENGFPEHITSYASKHKVVLAQVTRDSINEANAIQRGCSGVIYQDLRQDEVIRAIYSIQADEYWFSRKNISIALNNLMQFSTTPSGAKLTKEQQTVIDSLTGRERTILGLVCKGASNGEIANSLFISCHTVKTHIYSAFRKTQCKNRVELIYWGMRNTMSVQLSA